MTRQQFLWYARRGLLSLIGAVLQIFWILFSAAKLRIIFRTTKDFFKILHFSPCFFSFSSKEGFPTAFFYLNIAIY